MLRPNLFDTAIVETALTPLADRFAVDPAREGKVWRKLVSVFQSGYAMAPSEVAQALEREGWDLDPDLEDAVDEALGEVHRAHVQAVKRWVLDNAIAPKLNLGADVFVKRRGGEPHAGVIASIDADCATYVVCVPSQGHVKTGLGTRGWIVPFEEIHTLEAPPEAFELRSPRGA